MIQCFHRTNHAKAQRIDAIRKRRRRSVEKAASITLQAFARMAISRIVYIRKLGVYICCICIQSAVRGWICRRWFAFCTWKKQWEISCLPLVRSLRLLSLRLKAFAVAERGKHELRKAIKVWSVRASILWQVLTNAIFKIQRFWVKVLRRVGFVPKAMRRGIDGVIRIQSLWRWRICPRKLFAPPHVTFLALLISPF